MTASSSEYKTLLIFQSGISDDLVEQLRSVFATVHYYPIDGFRIKSTDVLPPPEHYATADVMLSFVIPPNLLSFDQTPRLKLFQALSAGVGHLTSTDYYKSLDPSNPLIFASASGIHAVTIGEHTLATTMMLFHRLHTMVIVGHEEKRWKDTHTDYGGAYVRVIRGMTVGIVGYGHIGAESARMFHAMGANIIALTRSAKPVAASGYIIPHTGDPTGTLPTAYYSSSSPQGRKSFFNACDVVINTLPSLESTKYFIDEETLKEMKGNAVLVNIGRGDTVRTENLIKALEGQLEAWEQVDGTGSLRIGGASLDVTDPEPLPDNHILFSLPNVIITPHMSGLSTDYYIRATDLLTQQAERLRYGKGALNAVRGRGEFQ